MHGMIRIPKYKDGKWQSLTEFEAEKAADPLGLKARKSAKPSAPAPRLDPDAADSLISGVREAADKWLSGQVETLKGRARDEFGAPMEDSRPDPVRRLGHQLAQHYKRAQGLKNLDQMVKDSTKIGQQFGDNPLAALSVATEAGAAARDAAKALFETEDQAEQRATQMQQGILRGAMIGAARRGNRPFQDMDAMVTPELDFTADQRTAAVSSTPHQMSIQDLNGNGIPDYQERDYARALYRAARQAPDAAHGEVIKSVFGNRGVLTPADVAHLAQTSQVMPQAQPQHLTRHPIPALDSQSVHGLSPERAQQMFLEDSRMVLTEPDPAPTPPDQKMESPEVWRVAAMTAEHGVEDTVTVDLASQAKPELDAGGPYQYRIYRVQSDIAASPPLGGPHLGSRLDASHSTVVMEKLDQNGVVVERHSEGFYPQSGDGIGLNVNGASKGEIRRDDLQKLQRENEGVFDDQTLTKITKEQYQTGVDELKRFKNLGENGDLIYSFTRNNCNGFFQHMFDKVTGQNRYDESNPAEYHTKGLIQDAYGKAQNVIDRVTGPFGDGKSDPK